MLLFRLEPIPVPIMASVYKYLKADRAQCEEVSFTATANYDGGDLVEIGDTVGVVYDPVASGEEGIALIYVPSKGVAVESGSVAFSVGDTAHYSTAAKNVNSTGSNPVVGRVLKAAASADDRVVIRLTNEESL